MNTTKNIRKTTPRYATIIRFLILSLTLGLFPYYPEPHLLGKIRWVAGGAEGMQPLDWFDLLLHGSPWILLTGSVLLELKRMFVQ